MAGSCIAAARGTGHIPTASPMDRPLKSRSIQDLRSDHARSRRSGPPRIAPVRPRHLAVADSRASARSSRSTSGWTWRAKCWPTASNVERHGFLRAADGFRALAAGARHHARAARGVRFRVRVPARRHEPQLHPDVETLFLTPGEQYMFISRPSCARSRSRSAAMSSPFVHPRWSPSPEDQAGKVAAGAAEGWRC
jgi:hypothetical protein